MKNRLSFTFLTLMLLALAFPCAAQTGRNQEILSEELGTLVRSKWEAIKIDAQSGSNEWAGEYRAFDGPIITTHLAWSSKSGFTVWWENCSRPLSSRVNYGSAEFQQGSIKVVPQLADSAAASFMPPIEFTPVKWGAQHFLIPSDQLMKFVYTVNSGSVSEIESFLMKTEDYEKQRNGPPKVPPAFTRYLGMKPINGVIAGVQPKLEERFERVILNVGKNNGVIPEMKFYLLRGKHFMVLEVTKVEERTAEASVYLATTRSDGNRIEPRVGWRVSSRAPKNSWQFMP